MRDGWEPDRCTTHSPWVCKDCGRRYTDDDDVNSGDWICPGCKAQHSAVRETDG